jgi:CheY-like chemotaxis protein
MDTMQLVTPVTLSDGAGSNSGGVHILVVDDSNLIQKTTSLFLKKAGYTVDIATNGAHCLKMMENSRCNVVLMDLQMHVLDGLETFKRMRTEEAASAF